MPKTGIFVAIPCKDRNLMKRATEYCLAQLAGYQGEDVFFQWRLNLNLNTPFATHALAEQFDRDFKECDWFLSFADDHTITVEDVQKLLACAERMQVDVVSGLVTSREKLKTWLVCGNHQPDGKVDLWKRGLQVSDVDVMTGANKTVDDPSGVALVHRRVIEALRPELNNDLPYWAYDKAGFSYDRRFFHRIKEKGFKCAVHCGVLIGHVGYEGRPDDGGIWIPDEPKRERVWNYWDCIPSVEAKKEEAAGALL